MKLHQKETMRKVTKWTMMNRKNDLQLLNAITKVIMMIQPVSKAMMTIMMKMMIQSSEIVYIVIYHLHHPPLLPKPIILQMYQLHRVYKSHVMIVTRLFALHVTGVMNIKQIMKLGFAIDVMPFIVRVVMRWINVKIVERLFVVAAVRYVVVSSVDVVYVKTVLQLVEGTLL
jgi:hypothetical protein